MDEAAAVSVCYDALVVRLLVFTCPPPYSVEYNWLNFMCSFDCRCIYTELHADLFSRYVKPLEVHVFVAVDEIGEDIMSDEMCHRCNRKQQGRRRGGPNVLLPD